MASVYHTFIEKGDTFTRIFRCKDASKNLVDLTGYTAEFYLAKADGTEVEMVLDTDYSLAISGGSITLTIFAETTTDWVAEPLYYELAVYTDDERDTILTGNLEVR